MDNSSKEAFTTSTKTIVIVVEILTIELFLLVAKTFGGVSASEYGLFAIALPAIIIIGMFPLLRKRHIQPDSRAREWFRIFCGQDAEGNPYLSIKGMPRNAIPAWLATVLLGGLIAWRMEGDSIFTRKILCALIFGLISFICFLIGVAICRMRIIITFMQDKFCVFRSIGLGNGRGIEFAYDQWCELRSSQGQGQNSSSLVFVDVNGNREALKCNVSNPQAAVICAYVNRQMSSHRAEINRRRSK